MRIKVVRGHQRFASNTDQRSPKGWPFLSRLYAFNCWLQERLERVIAMFCHYCIVLHVASPFFRPVMTFSFSSCSNSHNPRLLKYLSSADLDWEERSRHHCWSCWFFCGAASPGEWPLQISFDVSGGLISTSDEARYTQMGEIRRGLTRC